MDELPVSEHSHWNTHTHRYMIVFGYVCFGRCYKSSPSGNSVSLVSRVMAISSSVAVSSADRRTGEGEGGRRGGMEGEAERGSCGRDGDGGRFSASSLWSFLCRSSGRFLLL